MMFVPFQIPLAGKNTTHRRSKTITIVENQQRSISFDDHNFLSKKHIFSKKSTPQSQKNIHQKSKQTQIHTPISMKKISQKLQQLIKKETQNPQLISFSKQSPKKKKPKRYNSPQIIHSSSLKNRFPQTTKNNPTKQSSQYNLSHDPQLLAMIRQSQRLNCKSFVPHFNWKQKLLRLKNMGNYGHVYKQRPQKNTQNSIVYICESNKDEPFRSTKMKICSQNPNVLIQNFTQKSDKQKGKRVLTLNDSYYQKRQLSLKRYNNTCLMRQKKYVQSIDVKKHLNKFLRGRQNQSIHDQKWKFGPWDDNKG